MLNIQAIVTQVEPKIAIAWEEVELSRKRMNAVVGQSVKLQGNFTKDDVTTIQSSPEWEALCTRVAKLPSRFDSKAALSRLKVEDGTFSFLVG